MSSSRLSVNWTRRGFLQASTAAAGIYGLSAYPGHAAEIPDEFDGSKFQLKAPEPNPKYGGVLRYHLALEVPEPRSACRIRVDDRVASWEEGRSLVFDDTYEHEAWNDPDARRVILFVDFERPLPRALAIVNRLLIRVIAASPFVHDAIERYEEWTRRRAGGTRSASGGRRGPPCRRG